MHPIRAMLFMFVNAVLISNKHSLPPHNTQCECSRSRVLTLDPDRVTIDSMYSCISSPCDLILVLCCTKYYVDARKVSEKLRVH